MGRRIKKENNNGVETWSLVSFFNRFQLQLATTILICSLTTKTSELSLVNNICRKKEKKEVNFSSISKLLAVNMWCQSILNKHLDATAATVNLFFFFLCSPRQMLVIGRWKGDKLLDRSEIQRKSNRWRGRRRC